jgi:hypothetical protein
MNIVIDAAGRVLMYSNGSPTPPEGGALITLSAEQEAAFEALFGQPNVGFTFINGAFAVIPPPPPPVPQTASAGDFMRALIETGKYDAVDATVNAMTGSDGKLAKVLWTRASVFERYHPLVVQIGPALGVDLDALFTLANSYN